MPQFDASTFLSQVFWLSLTFAGLYVFAKKVLFPRFLSLKAQREKAVNRFLEDAERYAESTDQLTQALKDEKEALEVSIKAKEVETLTAVRKSLLNQEKTFKKEIDHLTEKAELDIEAQLSKTEKDLRYAPQSFKTLMAEKARAYTETYYGRELNDTSSIKS